MRLKEVLKALKDPDHVDEDEDVLNMQVEFNTINRANLILLSVYVYEGKIIVDVGE